MSRATVLDRPISCYDLIVCDLDGTLVDSLTDLTEAVNHMRAAFSRPSLPSETVRGMVGQGARNLVERALTGAGIADIEQGLELFLAYNHSHLLEHTTLYPGVAETLHSLFEQKKRLVVVSNKNTDLCRIILDELGVGGYFAAVLGADAVVERKPSPVPLLKLMAEFATPAASVLMVGDSINDIAAGQAAGVATVGCTYGYGEPAELQQATWLIDEFSHLLVLPLKKIA